MQPVRLVFGTADLKSYELNQRRALWFPGRLAGSNFHGGYRTKVWKCNKYYKPKFSEKKTWFPSGKKILRNHCKYVFNE